MDATRSEIFSFFRTQLGFSSTQMITIPRAELGEYQNAFYPNTTERLRNFSKPIFNQLPAEGGLARQILTVLIVEGEKSKFYRGQVPEQNFELLIGLNKRIKGQDMRSYLCSLTDQI